MAQNLACRRKNVSLALTLKEPSMENVCEFFRVVNESMKYTAFFPSPGEAIQIAGDIVSFQGEYLWETGRLYDDYRESVINLMPRWRRAETDLILACRIVLPTECEQIKINYLEWKRGLVATRAIVRADDEEINGRRIWFTKRRGKRKIYSKQWYGLVEESGRRVLSLD